MKLTTIIVFLIPVVVARHDHRTILESILKSKDNLYVKVDNDVQNVMNNLFEELKLAPTFPAKTRIKLLLTMHYDLNNMAEKNYDVYEKIIEAARPASNKGSKSLALFKLIEKTLDDKPFDVSVKLKENKTLQEPTKHENTIVQQAATISTTTAAATSLEDINQSDPVFADSKEFMKFIQDFIKKVDKLNETDFSKSTPLLPPIDEDTKHTDFEAWQPPISDNFNDSHTRRIFKGKRTGAKSYPFLVSIHLMEMFVCAGSIVSSDLIITAASCLQILHNNRFFRENPRVVQVRIGSDYFSRAGEMITVLESYFYPSYNPKSLANNLVILRLVRHIRFYRNEKRVKKIIFDREKGNLPINADGITVVGWGSRKRNNVIDQFEKMMAAKLDVYHLDECANVYGKQYVTNRHFCAGFIGTGGGACNKDLGGPGVVGGLLVGVISFGAPLCGAIDAPTVFTKLGHYSKWIDSIIKQSGRQLAVRTTLKFNTDKYYFFEPTQRTRKNPYFSYTTTRGSIEPITMFTEERTEYEPGLRRRTTPRTKIQQLFPYTPTTRHSMLLPMQLLRSIIYGEYGLGTQDGVNDMFKTTRELNVMQHPLVNLSFIPIPGVHSPGTQPPTTATHLPTQLTFETIPTSMLIFPTSTVTMSDLPASRTALIGTEHHITDLLTPGPILHIPQKSKRTSPKTASTTVATTKTDVMVAEYYYYDHESNATSLLSSTTTVSPEDVDLLTPDSPE